MGWIGVDFDGTLAEYHGWKSENDLGAPVPAMVARVKTWLAAGETVKIFSARVGISGAYSLESHRFADAEFAENQRRIIGDWCELHLGQRLEVTAVKDFALRELWDDRAVQVILNTGEPAGKSNATCLWKQSFDKQETYVTACGDEYATIRGTPAENRMTYCPNCGCRIMVVENA